MKRWSSAAILTLIVSVSMFGSIANAVAPKPEVTISPFLQEVRFSGNDATKDFDITLTNNSGLEQNFKLSVLDFGSLNDSGGIVFEGSSASSLLKKYGLANWLQLSSKNLTLEPGKSAQIVATIINDITLKPGGHYGAIVASLDSTNDSQPNRVSINQKLSSLILATKVGGEKYDLKLDNVITNGNAFGLPNKVRLVFKNPGNVHVVPRGTVKLVSAGGKVISEGVINEDSSFVLPETDRQLEVKLKGIARGGFWPSVYHVQIDYRYDGIERYAHKDHRIYFSNVPGFIISAVVLLLIGRLTWKHHEDINKVLQKLKKIYLKRHEKNAK